MSCLTKENKTFYDSIGEYHIFQLEFRGVASLSAEQRKTIVSGLREFGTRSMGAFTTFLYRPLGKGENCARSVFDGLGN